MKYYQVLDGTFVDPVSTHIYGPGDTIALDDESAARHAAALREIDPPESPAPEPAPPTDAEPAA